ncbi:hypothetical protein [Microcystis aeruginosa]|uniref:hypothetical protein n=1 Tax=Microcystis aeruginosa TaxID=1126 RepID=UPI002330E8EA|nr:hypothetical protein [Microcystis aeruginosa]MDB9393378.1 hypothetical protein [Microcystis aeruginosa CS-579]
MTIVAAKKEMNYFINKNTINRAKIVKGTATDLSFIENESVDYRSSGTFGNP